MNEMQGDVIIELLRQLSDQISQVYLILWTACGCIGAVGLLVAWHGGRK